MISCKPQLSKSLGDHDKAINLSFFSEVYITAEEIQKMYKPRHDANNKHKKFHCLNNSLKSVLLLFHKWKLTQLFFILSFGMGISENSVYLLSPSKTGYCQPIAEN